MNDFYFKMKVLFSNSLTASAEIVQIFTDIHVYYRYTVLHVLYMNISDSNIHDGRASRFIGYIKLLMMGFINYKLQHNVTFDLKGL